ncbi:MAG: ring-cleaving dioxygenase [Caldilineales bacterium]|nr:ring-cleaving dioxygenase [Caldilineales bacterium]
MDLSTATAWPIPGIHHITAICGDPQRNVDFYVGVLGLRLVKKTVNFDDPSAYHLYYGDGLGSPGTLMTFFAWELPPGVSARARPGAGQVAATAFWIPPRSLDFWASRLAAAGVDFQGPQARFDEVVISLRDPDGLALELVARDGGRLRAPWAEGPVPPEHAIQGFAGAALSLAACRPTARLLSERLGLRPVGSEGSRLRFQVGEGEDAAMIDLLCPSEAGPGRMGIGAVHHIAWRTPSRRQQEAWRRLLLEAGHDVTPIVDRQYFSSIYFREPGGVLFEIATDPPGMTVDEPAAALGAQLKLPPWLEPQRALIEARLPAVRWRPGQSSSPASL